MFLDLLNFRFWIFEFSDPKGLPKGPRPSESDGLGGEYVLPENGLWGKRTSDSDGPGPLGSKTECFANTAITHHSPGHQENNVDG